MCNLSSCDRPHGISRQGDHCERLSTERHELDLVSGPVLVNQHDRANVASAELPLGYIAREDDCFELLEHASALALGSDEANPSVMPGLVPGI
jgi:hypothetical protein